MIGRSPGATPQCGDRNVSRSLGELLSGSKQGFWFPPASALESCISICRRHSDRPRPRTLLRAGLSFHLAIGRTPGSGSSRSNRIPQSLAGRRFGNFRFPRRFPSYRRNQVSYRPKTLSSFSREAYDREGVLWQAEEVLAGGKWQRYYGFVGRHIIAKVPAEEIEVLHGFTSAHGGW